MTETEETLYRKMLEMEQRLALCEDSLERLENRVEAMSDYPMVIELDLDDEKHNTTDH